MFMAQNHVTVKLVILPLNKQTEVAFSLNILVLKGSVKFI